MTKRSTENGETVEGSKSLRVLPPRTRTKWRLGARSARGGRHPLSSSVFRDRSPEFGGGVRPARMWSGGGDARVINVTTRPAKHNDYDDDDDDVASPCESTRISWPITTQLAYTQRLTQTRPNRLFAPPNSRLGSSR